MKTPALYTIPAGVSFVDIFAAGLAARAGNDPLALSQMRILLPTRRAARSLREAFLRQSGGRPLLLPRMQPIGDAEEEELILNAGGSLGLPPAISPLRRQILLARAIGALPRFARGPEQDMALAAALGRLMDQVYTEDLDLAALPGLVDAGRFAKHWQVTVDFLAILSEHWPQILTENGVIDAADRRVRLIRLFAAQLKDSPPQHPVFAAGSTGSIPATAELLDVVAHLPLGAVVLPGLDRDMDAESWDALDAAHPQATLKALLARLGAGRQDVKLWPETGDSSGPRPYLASELMRPADTTARWQTLHPAPAMKEALLRSLSHVRRYECANPQEEAVTIACALRETLETPGRTAALITPDRGLATRVAAVCRRWRIEIDDSGGRALPETPAGSFLILSARAALEDFRPVALLALLKHSLCGDAGMKDFRASVRAMDKTLLRGPVPPAGLSGLRRRFESLEARPAQIGTLLSRLEPILEPLASHMRGESHAFRDLLDLHLRAAESLACTKDEPGVNRLWRGADGEAASAFISELREHATLLPRVNGAAYLRLLESLMRGVSVRPAFGLHPRLAILGQLEARLVQADRVILAGLNEGTWPPAAGHDPWMSRPMRADFGLPSPERAVGLAAHDFVQAFCAPDVILTRSRREGGLPTVPARWLARLDTVLRALDIDPGLIETGPHLAWARALDEPEAVKPAGRPGPRPPVQARPRALSVTKIETWLRDPYAIYARSILKLYKLEPLEQPLDAALRGTLLHEALKRFAAKYPADLPEDVAGAFLSFAREALAEMGDDPALGDYFLPRLAPAADWLSRIEEEWRQKALPLALEAEGRAEIAAPLGPFTLSARADRIDRLRDGSAALIDYKSGGQFTAKGMANGQHPQLPLEALILENGGFPGAPAVAGRLSYWVMGRKLVSLDGPAAKAATDAARAGLAALVAAYDTPDAPYWALPRPDRAPRYNDYAHLERVQEWAALNESDEAGEAA